MEDIPGFVRKAWNAQSTEGCRWSTPFPDALISLVKGGAPLELRLTPNRVVPTRWFSSSGAVAGLDVLALACGGGQQVPLLAAAGARVTSFELSDVQLTKDEEACARHGLGVRAIQGDMRSLKDIPSDSQDLIFNPVSNVFCEEISSIWSECARVLKPGGRLLAGFVNPAFFLFDHHHLEETGEPRVAHKLPYSDLSSQDPADLQAQLDAKVCLEFSHSWEEQIRGQCAAGLAIADFFEDDWDAESTKLQGWMPMYAATFAVNVDVWGD